GPPAMQAIVLATQTFDIVNIMPNKQILHGLDGVRSIADDILVFGSTLTPNLGAILWMRRSIHNVGVAAVCLTARTNMSKIQQSTKYSTVQINNRTLRELNLLKVNVNNVKVTAQPARRISFAKKIDDLIHAMNCAKKVIHDQIHDIPGAIDISDDVIIYGKSHQEHDTTLHKSQCLSAASPKLV
ncbi:Hypothetical predicted protein, partial [Paramuricea clavata]